MRGNRRRDTGPEMQLRRALHASGLRYWVDRRIEVAGIAVRADIVFPRHRLAVFIDGCFWHRCPAHFVASKSNVEFWASKIARNELRDRKVDNALRASDWSVLRIWAHDVEVDAVERVHAEVERSSRRLKI